MFTNIRGQSYMLFGGLDRKIISFLPMGSAAFYSSAFFTFVALLCLTFSIIPKKVYNSKYSLDEPLAKSTWRCFRKSI